MNLEQPVHVAVAVIENSLGEILIAKRPVHTHQGGLWEFPGGKVEANEAVQAALKREIFEELGIHLSHLTPLIKVKHQYPDKSVLLDVWKVTEYSGKAFGKEGQEIKWVSKSILPQFKFPQANAPIITASALPDKYMITGDFDSEEELFKKVVKAVDSGIELIQFRAHHLDSTTYFDMASKLTQQIKNQSIKILLNRSVRELQEYKLIKNNFGLHLSSMELKSIHVRPDFGLVAASVHNEEEVKLAEALGIDFCVLSPVKETSSHPQSQPLGWLSFDEIASNATVPLFALGGMKLADMEQVMACGAQGIAAISEFWEN